MADGTIRVIGLKQLSRDFKRISKDLSDELVDELKDAAEDVKDEAERLALTEIRNMPRSPRWAGMRIGVSRAQGLVYMVPAARSRRKPNRSRKNLAILLLDEAMDPAVERNADKVTGKVDDLLGRLADRHGF